MTNSVIGSLRVNLGLDSAKFQNGVKKLDQPLNRMKRQFAAVSVAAAAMGASIGAAALAGARQIDEAAKAARRLDSSIGGFRALELAASEAGVSLSTLTNDLQSMNRELANIGTSGNADRALQTLNLDLAQLEGLDADAKLATIADRVKDLGLTAGEATAVLRDLGVRNREMALLVLQGGDAIRAAREDIRSYGLEISKIDSDRIEAANDSLARLGLVTQYAGQQLAVALVPAMTKFSDAITDSLRDGGALRKAIDGLTNNIEAITTVVGVAVGVFGTRFAGALVLSRIATFNLTTALIGLRAAIASTGVGLLVIGLGTLAAKLLLARDSTVEFEDGVYFAEGAQRSLNAALDTFRDTSAPSAGQEAVNLAKNMLTEAQAAYEAAAAQRELARSRLSTLQGMEATSPFAQSPGGNSVVNEAAAEAEAAEQRAVRALQNITDAQNRLKQIVTEVASSPSITTGVVDPVVVERATVATRELGSRIQSVIEGLEDVPSKVNEGAEAIRSNLTSAVNQVAEAFAQWTVDGFKDFKGMVSNVLGAFKAMIARMIATAAANKILIGMGLGGSVAGSAASAATSAALSGAGSAAAGSGIFAGLSGAASAIGAALPIIGGVALAFGALRKKTTTLDKGIKVAIDGLDVSAQTFKKTQTSRFFGLSKRNRTRTRNDPNNPITAAVAETQAGIMEAARVMGVGASAFENFSYRFKVSLKGLTAEQRTAKINEELARMGDGFASLVPNIENMNELLERASKINQNIRALTDRQGLFATSADAVFAASAAGRQIEISDVDVTPSWAERLIRAVREGDVNGARLTAQLVAIEQRRDLEPT